MNFLRNLDYQHLVHVQRNDKDNHKKHTDWKKTIYFVEIDVKKKSDGLIYRFSHFVRTPPNEICFAADYEWKINVRINIITAIKNNQVWLKYLLYMLKNIQENTKDTNVRHVFIFFYFFSICLQIQRNQLGFIGIR